MSKVVLENVGPVKHFEFEVPADGGVVVLRGRNGAGKSHILDAVQSLVSGDGSVPLRDGQAKGKVEGLGATIKFAKRTTRSGELEVESLTGDVDPAALVDPGIDNAERADAARIKALLTLAGVQATPANFRFADAEIELPEGETDPVKLAGLAAREYQRLAREEEAKTAKLQQVMQSLGSVQVEYDGETDTEVLEQKLIDAKAGLQAAKQGQQDALRQQDAYLKAQAELEASANGIEERLAAARARRDTSMSLFQEMNHKVQEAKAALVTAESHCKAAESEALQANRDCVAIEHEASRFESLRATIAQGCPKAITDGLLTAYEKAVEICRDDMQKAALVRQNEETAQEREQLATDIEHYTDRAAKLRKYASRCEQALSDMVGQSGTGLFVEGGRLRIASDRGPDELFSELSHGERWKAAIDVCVSSVGNKALIVIPQEAWEGIDPVNRERLAEFARERSVTILTAECGDGEIQAGGL